MPMHDSPTGGYPPTDEQTAAVDLFTRGHDLAIEAGAGTGKTSTLRLLAEAARGRTGQYVAFNKAIVTEAKRKMPDHFASNTAHSLAFAAVGHQYASRLSAPRMAGWEIASRLGVSSIYVTYDGKRKLLTDSYLAGTVMRGIVNFCQSIDPEPAAEHVPFIRGIDTALDRTNNREVARALVPAMRRAWADLTNPDGHLSFRHDHYLRIWQMSDPRIPVDVILFDEAQDANPVMRAVVAAQRHAQVVWVGDSCQQIYEFTGAVNALAQVDADHRTFLSRSFRFGQGIADLANELLDRLDADLRLSGNPGMTSTVGEIARPTVKLCRTNAVAVATCLRHLAAGQRPHLVGGADEVVRFATAAKDLQNGDRTYHPDLACFSTWGEVQEYVEHDQQGDELRLLVGLVDEFGVDTIIGGLSGVVPESSCDVTISTAHKAKGREWSSVALASDFPPDPEPEELRLLYVAVTRAQDEVDVTRVQALGGTPQVALPGTSGVEEPVAAVGS